MKLSVLTLFLFWFYSSAFATDLPVRFYNSTDKTKPLLFYITGDGGWNDFSTALVTNLNAQGFPVIGLDAKLYFKNRKTPEQTAQDAAALLQQYRTIWNEQGVVFIGYSFGADVFPFIQNRLPQPVIQHLKTTLLLSPSDRTDFEVHLLDAFISRSAFPVMPEINQLKKPTSIYFGMEEESDYAKVLTSKKVQVHRLTGGHHYNNDAATLTKQLLLAIEQQR